ncbi:MAG: tetratricopeptide repeat protein [Anaerolineae bacterium]|nr:tetratricopeptide repeat protein [Anaerolineae bacterium]
MTEGGALKRAWHWVLSRFFRRLADVHRHYGNLYGSRDEYWAAIENYTRAVELDPAYAQVYYSRGLIYWREVGNHYRAIEDLTRVIEIDPSRAEAYFNRAMAYQARHETEHAIADLEHYLAEGQDEYWIESASRQLVELRAELAGGTPDA